MFCFQRNAFRTIKIRIDVICKNVTLPNLVRTNVIKSNAIKINITFELM